MTEDEMVGWHHRLNGHEFEQALGDSDGQGTQPEREASYSLRPLLIATGEAIPLRPNFTGGLTPFRPQSGLHKKPREFQKKHLLLLY